MVQKNNGLDQLYALNASGMMTFFIENQNDRKLHKNILASSVVG